MKKTKKRPHPKKKVVKRKAEKGKTVRKGVVALPKKLEAKLGKFALVEEEKFFLLKNGRKLKSLLDLWRSLEKMSDEVFLHHVTPYKNDFSAWIYHVFNEVELGRLLANEKNKKQTKIIIKEYFK
ncbi:MAG: hypothetical protein ABIJ21_01015 [Nanoarchaeota archaeon]